MRVYTVLYRHADFLPWQVALWQKFCPHMSEFVAANNGPDYDALDDVCCRLGIRSIRCPLVDTEMVGIGAFAVPRDSHAHALNHVLWSEAAACGEDVFLSDFDLFPLRPVRRIEADMAGMAQGRADVKYFWPGCLFIGRKCPGRGAIDFRSGFVRGHRLDTGMQISLYLEAHPQVITEDLQCALVQPADLPPPARDLYRSEFEWWSLDHGTYLHYLRGSDWQPQSAEVLAAKRECLRTLIEGVLSC